ncbi:MAG: hypothetical protein COA74_14985 [Gammaproteobacteria bacterium]|nr:MAG: hypothetical protein COA74_14985 [Gammaproteobacteria bacterium]
MNQKQIGYTMVGLSFLGSAFITSLDTNLVNWNIFLPTLVVGILGVTIVNKALKREAHSEGVITINLSNIESSINRIVNNLVKLNQEKSSFPAYEIRFEIDKVFREDLSLFAESRRSLGHRYGLQPYAEVMSSFAAGERFINRVWSASADSYVDEVSLYLVKAQEQFIDARDLLNGIMKKTSKPKNKT